MGWRAAGNESQDYFYGRVSNFGGEGETKGGGRESWKLAYRRVEILADMIAGDKGRDRLFENDPGQVETWLIVATKRGKEAADYDSSGFVVRSLRVCIHLSRHLDCSYCSRFPGR